MTAPQTIPNLSVPDVVHSRHGTIDAVAQQEPDRPVDPRLEATELTDVNRHERRRYYYGGNGQVLPGFEVVRNNAPSPTGTTSTRHPQRWFDGARKFWKRQISVIVSADSRRDHLALERTFLSYLRTSLALSMTGVLIAQLFRIQHSLRPDLEFGFYVVGRPLAAILNFAALMVILIGAWRFWRQQNAMLRGKILAGGWEITSIMVLGVLLGLALFAITVGVGIRREL